MEHAPDGLAVLNPHLAEEFVVELVDVLDSLAATPCVWQDANTTCSPDSDPTPCNPCLARHLLDHLPAYPDLHP